MTPNSARKLHRVAMLWFLAAIPLACSRYAVTLNDQPFYTPPPLFTDFQIDDHNLLNCVQQTIADQNITEPTLLTRLICTHTGIVSVQGLTVFSHLAQVDLSHNAIQSIAPLLALPALKMVKIVANPLDHCLDVQALLSRGVEVVGAPDCNNNP